jgi:hypothetical protein
MMTIRICLGAASAALLFAGAAVAQPYPVADRVAQKVIQKYQTSTCEQLWAEKAAKAGQPKSPMEERAVQMLRQDPAMRQAFLDQIAAPVVNKLFECGMVP